MIDEPWIDINQGFFWKAIFFCSSITFAGIFVSLPLSIAIVAMIHVHCCAHSYAREKLDLELSGIMHIPFLGAIVMHKGNDFNLTKSFLASVAGPLMGFIATGIMIIYFIVLKNPFIGEMVKIMLLLNIVNLLPLTFLDGQSIAQSLSFGKNRVIELLLCIVGIIISFALFFINIRTNLVASLFWVSLFFSSIHDFMTFLTPKYDCREMSHKVRFLALAIYASLFTIFIFFYKAFETFSGTGAATGWVFP